MYVTDISARDAQPTSEDTLPPVASLTAQMIVRGRDPWYGHLEIGAPNVHSDDSVALAPSSTDNMQPERSTHFSKLLLHNAAIFLIVSAISAAVTFCFTVITQ